MRDYRNKKKREREPIIRQLFSLGISESDIADLVGVCALTVKNDIRGMGGNAAFPARPSRTDAFASALRRYAELACGQAALTEEEEKIRSMLGEFLQVTDDRMEDAVWALTAVRTSMLAPDIPSGMDGYYRLLQLIFGRDMLPDRLQDKVSAGKPDTFATEEYVRAIGAGTEPLPTTRPEFIAAFAGWTVRQYRGHVRTAWPLNAKQALDRILLTLDQVYALVIRMRCGIGTAETAPMTYVQVGACISMTLYQARELERKALKELRHPTVKAMLQPLVDPPRDLADRVIASELGRWARETFPMPGATSDFMEKLLTPVELLRMSVRLANGLRNLKVYYVGDWIQLTERDMLRPFNLGQMTLHETHGILATMGLTLGTRLDESTRRAFHAMKMIDRDLAPRTHKRSPGHT